MEDNQQTVPETKSSKDEQEQPIKRGKIGEIDSLDPNVDQDLMRLSGGY